MDVDNVLPSPLLLYEPSDARYPILFDDDVQAVERNIVLPFGSLHAKFVVLMVSLPHCRVAQPPLVAVASIPTKSTVEL